ncbi:MAG: DNA polymerase IV [Patescibacteria group bacterium]
MQQFAQAVLHIDGDAFFASVVQAVHPELRGKPIATGGERGMALAVSYEAKRMGVKRCMPAWEIRKICPECIIVSSEFKLYHLFSKRMFEIIRTFSPIVEEYSIDEAFVDISDLPRYYKMDYQQIGTMIMKKIEDSLGITASIGISSTKSLAKIGSNYNKPNGLLVIDKENSAAILKSLPVQEVWGIGNRSTSKLKELNIHTAFDYISHSEAFIKKHLSKPYLEIWRELQGKMMYKIDPEAKTEYKSMSKIITFQPTRDREIIWARLITRVEEAFEKARRYNYTVGRVGLVLKTQEFAYEGIEVRLSEKAQYPYLIKDKLREAFLKIYKADTLYRATMCNLFDFEETSCHQSSLFRPQAVLEEKIKSIYPLYEQGKIAFGTSLLDQHEYDHKPDKFKIPMLKLV